MAKKRSKLTKALTVLKKLDMVARERDKYVNELAVARDRAERLDKEVSRLSQRIADNDQRYERTTRELEDHRNRSRQLMEERDRILRLVDQFTSMNISSVASSGANSPADLRTLRKV